MKNSKKQRLAREVEQNMCACNNNPTMGNVELKAGNLAHLFGQLDPETSVFTTGDGQFAIHASDADIERLEQTYCDDLACANDYNPLDEEPKETYGDVVDISNYDTGNFAVDTENMDCDFAHYIASELIETNNLISMVLENHAKNVLDNLVNYQNTKNTRTKVEVARVIEGR